MNNQSNIFLIGLMGSGKTTIAKLLADELNKQFIDLDDEIEKSSKKSINEIFADEGEGYFRQLEKKLLSEITQQNNVVLATGGGVILDETNRAILKTKGLVFYLTAEISVLLDRLANTKNRPLLNVADPSKKLAELFAERKDMYLSCAHYVIETDAKSSDDVVECISSYLSLQI